MEKLFAAEFVNMVSHVITKKEDKDILFTALQDYRDSKNVYRLTTRLKHLINNPERLPLVDLVRTVIADSDQITYDKASYWVPRTLGSYLHGENHYRLVRISRRAKRTSGDSVANPVSLGFAVRGGLEHGTGIFVSQVLPDSIAWKEGLRIGDQILRVNGLPLDQSTHAEATNIIKNAAELQFKVRRIGMIPSRKHTTSSEVKWKYCSDIIRKQSPKLLNDVIHNKMIQKYKSEEVHRPVALCLTMHKDEFSLGCIIRSMPSDDEVQPNRIFIQSVNKSGLAYKIGLQPGDEILAANYVLLRGLSHSDVIVELKKCTPLNLLIKQQSPPLIPESELMQEEQHIKIKSNHQMSSTSYTTHSKGFIRGTMITPTTDSNTSSERRSKVTIVKEEPDPRFTYTTPPSIPLLSNNSKFNVVNGRDEKHYVEYQHITRKSNVSIGDGDSSHQMKDFHSLPIGSKLPPSPVLMNPPMENRKQEVITLQKNEFVRGFGFHLEEGHGEMFNNKYAVSYIQEHSPAYQLGISKGDFILEINGRELSKMPPNEVHSLIEEIDSDESIALLKVKVAKISQEIYCELSVAYYR